MLRAAYPIWDRRRWNDQKHVYTLPQGGMVYVETAERPVISLEAHAIWIDEPAQMLKARYDDCESRRLTTGGPMWITGTPESGHDWYARLIKSARAGDPGRHLFVFTCYDNPAISDAAIDAARRNLSDTEFRRRMLGEAINAEGLVYAGFDFDEESRKHRGENMCDMPSPERFAKGQVWGTIDTGYAAAFAAGWFLVENRDENGKEIQTRYTKFAEYKKPQLTDPECADLIVEHPEAHRTAGYVVDSADRKFAELLRLKLRSAKLDRSPVLLVRKRRMAERDFIPWSVDHTRVLINTRRYRLVRGMCPETEEELSLYRYPEAKEDRHPDDIPVGANDHLLSGDRYLVVTVGMRGTGGTNIEMPDVLKRANRADPKVLWARRSLQLSSRGVALQFPAGRRGKSHRGRR